MLGQKHTGDHSGRQPTFDDAEEVAAERRALRLLRDSLQTEPEELLEETLYEPSTRRNIGKFIGFAMVKPYSGEA